MSIKYYQLAKDEELPDEFCAVRDVGGEPSEYMFYVPEAENDKLRHDLEEANNQAEEVCIENAKLIELVEDMLDCIQIRAAFNRPPTAEMYETFYKRARELGVDS